MTTIYVFENEAAFISWKIANPEHESLIWGTDAYGTCAGAVAKAQNGDTIEVYGKPTDYIYAKGKDIIIKQGSFTGSAYGNANTGTVAESNVVIEGGEFASGMSIYGGGGVVTGASSLVITGGTFDKAQISAGGASKADSSGATSMIVTGGTFLGSNIFYGGAIDGTTGDVYMKFSDLSLNNDDRNNKITIYGGTYNKQSGRNPVNTGNVTMDISNGTYYKIYGSGRSAVASTIQGNVSITVSNAKVGFYGNFTDGVLAASYSKTNKIIGNVDFVVKDNTLIKSSVYLGCVDKGSDSVITGDVSFSIDATSTINGAISANQIDGNVTVNLYGGVVKGDISGGTFAEKTDALNFHTAYTVTGTVSNFEVISFSNGNLVIFARQQNFSNVNLTVTADFSGVSANSPYVIASGVFNFDNTTTFTINSQNYALGDVIGDKYIFDYSGNKLQIAQMQKGTADGFVYMNTDWTNKKTGDWVLIDGICYEFGVDAFASLDSARVALQDGEYVKIAGGIYESFFLDGKSDVHFVGGTFKKDIYGASNVDTPLVGDTKVIISGGTVTGKVYGGGLSDVTGDTSVEVSGNVTGNIAGGGNNSGVSGTASVVIKGGTNGSIYGAGTVNNASDKITVGNASVVIDGGTVSNVYGGGSVSNGQLEVTGTASVIVNNGGTVSANIYGGGDASYGANTVLTVGKTDIQVSGTVGGMIFGAMNVEQGSVGNVGEVSIIVKDGSVAKGIYGGGFINGHDGSLNINKSAVKITGGKVKDIYGGTDVGGVAIGGGGSAVGPDTKEECKAVTDNSSITISGTAEAGLIIGGGMNDYVKKSEINIQGGSVSTIYGGGYGYNRSGNSIKGNAWVDESKILISDGTVKGNIYGGGIAGKASSASTRPYSSTVGSSQIILTGGFVMKNIYGGGASVNTTVGSVDIKISGGEVKGAIYAGGVAGSIVTGDASITISGGVINGAISGGGDGANATVTGKSTLNFTNSSAYTLNASVVKDFDVIAFNGETVTFENAVDFSGVNISIKADVSKLRDYYVVANGIFKYSNATTFTINGANVENNGYIKIGESYYQLIASEDDIKLTKGAATDSKVVLQVNSLWVDKVAGDFVKVGDVTYIIGTNAFADANSAISAKTSATREIYLDGKNGQYYVSQDVSFSGGTLSVIGDNLLSVTDGIDITFAGKGVRGIFNVVNIGWGGTEGISFNVNNGAVVDFGTLYAQLQRNTSLNVNNAQVNTGGSLMVTQGAETNLTNKAKLVNSATSEIIVTGDLEGAKSSLNINNSILGNDGVLRVGWQKGSESYTGGVVNVANGGVVNNGTTGSITTELGGVFELNSNATLNNNGQFSGDLGVSGANNTINNNGKLAINNLIGSAKNDTLTIICNANIKNANFGAGDDMFVIKNGSVNVTGGFDMGDGNDTVKLDKGTLKLNSAADLGKIDKLTGIGTIVLNVIVGTEDGNIAEEAWNALVVKYANKNITLIANNKSSNDTKVTNADVVKDDVNKTVNVTVNGDSVAKDNVVTDVIGTDEETVKISNTTPNNLEVIGSVTGGTVNTENAGKGSTVFNDIVAQDSATVVNSAAGNVTICKIEIADGVAGNVNVINEANGVINIREINADASTVNLDVTNGTLNGGKSGKTENAMNITGKDVIIENNGHINANIKADSITILENTSMNTILGTYDAKTIKVNNTGRISAKFSGDNLTLSGKGSYVNSVINSKSMIFDSANITGAIDFRNIRISADTKLDVTENGKIFTVNNWKGDKNFTLDADEYLYNIKNDYAVITVQDNKFSLANDNQAGKFIESFKLTQTGNGNIAQIGEFIISAFMSNVTITIVDTKTNKKLFSTTVKAGTSYKTGDLNIFNDRVYTVLVDTGKNNAGYTINYKDSGLDIVSNKAKELDFLGVNSGYVGFNGTDKKANIGDRYSFTIDDSTVGAYGFTLSGLAATAKVQLVEIVNGKAKVIKTYTVKQDSSLTFNNLDQGKYEVRVISGDNAAGKQNTNYDLTVNRNNLRQFVDSTNNEFNVDSALFDANDIYYVGFGDVVDNYKLTDKATNNFMSLKIKTTSIASNAKVEILNAKGKVIYSTTAKGGEATFSDIVLGSNNYYVRVTAPTNNGSKDTEYKLSAEFENNTNAGVQELAPGILYKDDTLDTTDYFKFAADSKKVNFNLDVDDANSNKFRLDVYGLDRNGKMVLKKSVTSAKDLNFTLSMNQNEIYYAKLTSVTGADIKYDLTILNGVLA